MTLRVTVEIVPYGDEDSKYKVGELNISNLGTVDDLGFGHKICRYQAIETECPPDSPILKDLTPEKLKWPAVERHDRRDGFWVLIGKAILGKYKEDFATELGEYRRSVALPDAES